MRKEEPTVGGSEMDYITVQRLPPIAEGRYQKYAGENRRGVTKTPTLDLTPKTETSDLRFAS